MAEDGSAIDVLDLDAVAIVVGEQADRLGVRCRHGRERRPREYPLVTELASVLREHRRALVERQAPGLSDGWVFPSEVGTLRTQGSLWKAWQGCIEAIGFAQRFTVHGLRRTFNDLARRAGAHGIVIRSLTGHVTEKMREHYSTIALDEKRQTAVDVVLLVGASPAPSPQSPTSEGSGTRWSNLEIDWPAGNFGGNSSPKRKGRLALQR